MKVPAQPSRPPPPPQTIDEEPLPGRELARDSFATPVRALDGGYGRFGEEVSTYDDENSASRVSSSAYPSWIRPSSDNLASISSSGRFSNVQWLGGVEERREQQSPVRMQSLSALAHEAMELARAEEPQPEVNHRMEDVEDDDDGNIVAAFIVVDIFGSR